MKIHRPITESIRENLTWEERWRGHDGGLISCWERGREKRLEDSSIAAKATAGQLPILPWKGGVERKIKKEQKFGTLHYLAMWQGLRGEDLNIDRSAEVSLVCAVTGVIVVYTNDSAKYAEA